MKRNPTFLLHAMRVVNRWWLQYTKSVGLRSTYLVSHVVQELKRILMADRFWNNSLNPTYKNYSFGRSIRSVNRLTQPAKTKGENLSGHRSLLTRRLSASCPPRRPVWRLGSEEECGVVGWHDFNAAIIVKFPRKAEIFWSVRSRVFAAKLPSAQMILGWMHSICFRRNGSQVSTSTGFGFRFPGGRHLMTFAM